MNREIRHRYLRRGMRALRRFSIRLGLIVIAVVVIGEILWSPGSGISRGIFQRVKSSSSARTFSNDGALKILAIGDSYVWGANSDRQALNIVGFPEILERILVLPDGRTASQTVNVAIPASDTGSILRGLKDFLRREPVKPNVVLIAGGINNLAHWSYYECAQERGLIRPTSWDRIRHFLGTHSFWIRLFVYSRLAFGLNLPPWATIDREFSFTEDCDLAWRDARAPEAIATCVERDLEAIVGEVRATGAAPILVTYHQGWFLTDMQRRFAHDHDVTIVDVPEFAERCERPTWLEYRCDADWHPDLRGQVFVAYATGEKLLELPQARERGLKLRRFDEFLTGMRSLLKADAAPIPKPCMAP